MCMPGLCPNVMRRIYCYYCNTSEDCGMYIQDRFLSSVGGKGKVQRCCDGILVSAGGRKRISLCHSSMLSLYPAGPLASLIIVQLLVPMGYSHMSCDSEKNNLLNVLIIKKSR